MKVLLVVFKMTGRYDLKPGLPMYVSNVLVFLHKIVPQVGP